MRNKCYSVALWVCMLLFAPAAMFAAGTVLTAGDIAVLGWNSRGETGPNQRWAFITFVDLQVGTTINFTDNGYDNTLTNFRASPNSNDGHMSWTTSSFIAKGTVIYCTNNSVNGVVTGSPGVTGNLGTSPNYFSLAGDQIIVYQGTMGTAAGATFIYALNTGQSSFYSSGGNGSWYTGGSAVSADNISYLPPGLSATTAVALTSASTGASSGTGSLGSSNYGFDNMRYAGITSGTKTQILTAMSSATNWLGNNTTSPYDFSTGGVYPTNAFTVLPVTLLSYTAQLQANETVQLVWETAAEINNDHFTIERSADGIQFGELGRVAAKGNNEPARYSFTDQLPEAGNNFYRLSQTDIDGREKILGIRTVTLQNTRLRLSPNPATDAINVRFGSGNWQEIILFNSAGQLLQSFQLTARDSRLRISLSRYQPGSYFLAFIAPTGQVQTVKRFVVAP